MPEADCRTMPARSISRCETICASLGFSFSSGRKYWDRRILPGTRVVSAGAPHSSRSPRDAPRRLAPDAAMDGTARHMRAGQIAQAHQELAHDLAAGEAEGFLEEIDPGV